MTPEQKTQTVTHSFGQPDSVVSTRTWATSTRDRPARDFLLSLQHPDGYWCSELEADSMLEADYINCIPCSRAAIPPA